MGFTYLTPPVVGGTVLIIERIESQNYDPGVAGWTIEADGDAEFNDVVVRGSLITGVAPGERIEINGTAFPNDIAFYTGDSDERVPARLNTGPSGGTHLSMRFEGPESFEAADGNHAIIEMESSVGAPGTSSLGVDSDVIRLTAGDNMTLEGTTLELTDFDGVLEIVSAVIRKQGETWHGTADTPLAGTWVDTAGSRFAYYKDATGRVQVRGRVSGGGAGATVVTLPVGYRPSSNLEFTMRAGTVVSAVSVSTGGVLTVTANLATASGSGIYLDVISFPTF
jgi:hypothetical protein